MCRAIYAHGFTVDEKGIKMSKSIGNVISPKDIITEHYVDAFRWWVASHAIQRSKIPVKSQLLAQAAENVARIRIILKFLLAYVPSATTEVDQIEFNFDKLTALDKYILNSLVNISEDVCNLSFILLI